jgi:hypothetical protein
MHVFECDTVVKSAVSLGKSFLWVLLFGLLPLCLSGLLFFVLTKRKSGWGIAGRLGCVSCVLFGVI